MRGETRRGVLRTLAWSGLGLSGFAWLTGAPLRAGAAEVLVVERPAGVGSTRRLEILPLLDWFAAPGGYDTEAGVSYLVRTDSSTILFDVGDNQRRREPWPIVANMRRLGVRLEDIDTIVISHPHMDHVGGLASARAGTFAIASDPVDLAGKRLFVPSPMRYPGLEPVVVRAPLVIAPGVVSTGPIGAQLNVGPVQEQALAIRVRDKGIVLVVGCGHQGMQALLARRAALFDEPLYGVVGGLHYPLPNGRLLMNGVDVQRWATWGSGPGPSAADVGRDLDALAAQRPQWVSLSPHDSSDEMIETFRQRFGTRYHDLRVGEAQVLGASP